MDLKFGHYHVQDYGVQAVGDDNVAEFLNSFQDGEKSTAGERASGLQGMAEKLSLFSER